VRTLGTVVLIVQDSTRHPARRYNTTMLKDRRLLALVVLLSACGSGGGGRSFEDRFADVESCAALSAAMPAIRFDPAVDCPTSRRRCCLAKIPFFECAAGLCGANGSYEQDTGTIVLPVGCSIGFEHESVHHLLFETTGDADASHTSPLFEACGNS